MNQGLFSVQYSAVPEAMEDHFELCSGEHGAFLCVADGCGGLGSRRYPQLENRTGASLAAELTARAAAGWWQSASVFPDPREQGQTCGDALAERLHEALTAFSKAHPPAGTRIVGSMQRELPTTLCLAWSAAAAEPGRRDVCFAWAGDSRGYVLDANGLHQCTQDHLRGGLDPLSALYRDVPLSNLVWAGQKPRLSLRRFRLQEPFVLAVATDGVFGGLRTPMEMEMLLIDTLLAAKTPEGWQRKLGTVLKKTANDDATLLVQVCGCKDMETLQQLFHSRRTALQKQYITPVRRNRGNMSFVEARWKEYRPAYQWMEERANEPTDWRL